MDALFFGNFFHFHQSQAVRFRSVHAAFFGSQLAYRFRVNPTTRVRSSARVRFGCHTPSSMSEIEEVKEVKAPAAAPEPTEIKLHLGDRKLERWVEDLKAAPAKLNALKDAVVDLALKLHETHAGVNDLEVSIGDMDSDVMSTAYELEHLQEQIAEQGPEQARLRKATAAMQKQLEQLAAVRVGPRMHG